MRVTPASVVAAFKSTNLRPTRYHKVPVDGKCCGRGALLAAGKWPHTSEHYRTGFMLGFDSGEMDDGTSRTVDFANGINDGVAAREACVAEFGEF